MQPGLGTICIRVLIAFSPAYYRIVILSPLGGRNLYMFFHVICPGLGKAAVSQAVVSFFILPQLFSQKPHFLITPKRSPWPGAVGPTASLPASLPVFSFCLCSHVSTPALEHVWCRCQQPLLCLKALQWSTRKSLKVTLPNIPTFDSIIRNLSPSLYG